MQDHTFRLSFLSLRGSARVWGCAISLLILSSVSIGFAADGFTTEPLVVTGDPAPGTEGGTFYRFGWFDINDLDEVVFSATVSNGSTNGGIFKYSNGVVQPVYLVGEPLPSGATDLSVVEPLINNRGHIVFRSPLGGEFLYTDGVLSSVVTIDMDPETEPDSVGAHSQNDLDQIVLAGGTATNGVRLFFASEGHVTPALPDEFQDVVPTFLTLNRKGQLAFEEQSLSGQFNFDHPGLHISLLSDGEVIRVASDGDLFRDLGCPEPWCAVHFAAPLENPTLNDAGDLVFSTDLDDGTTRLFRYRGIGGSLDLFRAGPAASPSDGSFSDVSLNNAGSIALAGTWVLESGIGGGEETGVLFAGKQGLTRIASEGDPAPGLPGTYFGSLITGRVDHVALNNLDTLVFAGKIAGNTEGDGLFVAQPSQDHYHYLYFPQYGSGSQGSAAWISSDVTLFNATTTAVDALVEFRDNAGNLLTTILNGEIVAGRTTAFVPPGGSVTLVGSTEGSLQAGSVVVRSVEPIGGYVLYRSSDGLAAVNPSRQISGFRAPVRSGRGFATGLALMGFDDGQTVLLDLIDEEGNTLSSADVPLAARGHVARLLDELTWDPPVDMSSFSGTIKAQGSSSFSATLILLAGGQYATLPIDSQE